MARVNPPPNLRIPKQFLKDPEVREFIEKQQFIIFQLWTRTGGGADAIEQIINNEITNNNITSFSAAELSRLRNRVQELEDNDITSQFHQSIAALNQRINALLDELLTELQEFHRPNELIEQEQSEAIGDILEQLQLLNARVEDAFETEIDLEDLELDDDSE